MELYDISSVYSDFIFPKEFLKVVKHDLVDFDYWYILTSEQMTYRISGLKKRYPSRRLVPFARRDDCDDIACFELDRPGTVQIIHDYASETWEQRREYASFWEWFRDAIEEMISGFEVSGESE